MAVSLEAAFYLIDHASGPLKDIERQAAKTDKALRGMGGAGGGMADFKKQTTAVQDYGSAVEEASAKTKTFTNTQKDVVDKVKSAGREVERHTGFIRKHVDQVKNWTRELLRNHTALANTTKTLAGFGGALKGAATSLPLMVQGVIALAPAVVSLTGALTGLVVSLGAAVGGGAMLGGGLLGSFAAGIGSIYAVAKPAITGVQNYRKAVTDLNTAIASGDPKKVQQAQQALDKLSKQNPGVAQLSRNLDSFKKSWDKAIAPSKGDFFTMANTGLAAISRQFASLGPQIQKNVRTIRTAVDQNIGPLADTFSDIFTQLSRIFRSNFGGFMAGILNIFKGLSNILKVIAPQLGGIGDGFEKLTGKFEKWTETPKGIKDTTDAFHAWASLLGGIVRLIGIVLGSSSRQGTAVIKGWADSINRIADRLEKPGGTKGMESWIQNSLRDAGKLVTPLKNIATSMGQLYTIFKPLGQVTMTVLAHMPPAAITAIATAVIGGKVLGGAFGGAKGAAGVVTKFLGGDRGSTPGNPLYVADVTGGITGGGGGLGLRERFTRTRLGGRLARTKIGGRLLGYGGEAVENFGLAGGVLPGAAAAAPGIAKTAEREAGPVARLLAKIPGLSTLSARTGIGRAGGAVVGEEGMSLFSRLTRGGGWHGIGGATGGFTGMGLAMMAPALARLVPKGIRESGIGKWAGGTLGGFLSGGMLGAGVQGINALLPAGLRRGAGTRAGVDIGMAASTGGTIAPALGVGMLPGAIIGGGLAAGSILRNRVGGIGGRLASIGTEAAAGAAAGSLIPVVGTGVGAAVGAGVGAAQAYNPFSAKGRRNIVADAKTTWNALKTGAKATGEWVAKTASYYNPFTAKGQKHIADSAVHTWNTVKKGVTEAGQWVGRQAVKFNPFSERGRKNIANGAQSAWRAVKTAFGAAGKWFAGVGKDISRPFVNAFDWVKRAGKNTWNWLKTAASNVVKAVGDFFTKTPLGRYIMWPFKTAFNWIKGRIEDVVGWFKGLPDRIWSAIKGLGNTISKPFKDAWDFIKGIPGKIGGTAKSIGSKIASPFKAVGHFFGLAEGGTLRRGATALVGERGPEVVHLPAGAHVTPTHQLPQLALQAGTAGAAAGMGAAAGQANASMFKQIVSQVNRLNTSIYGTKGLRQGLNVVQNQFQSIRNSVKQVNNLTQALTAQKGLQWALNKTGDNFNDMTKQSKKDLDSIQSESNGLIQWMQKNLPDGTKQATDAITQNFNQANKNVQKAWKDIVFNTRWGINQIYAAMAKGFKTIGVSMPKGLKEATGGGGSPPSKAAKGTRLPGEPKGDHIPLLGKGGGLLGIADGGELVVNRHTENRVNSLLADKGTTLGKEVAGEQTPHWKQGKGFANGGRIPTYQHGGVVQQVDQFFKAHGYNKVAIAGILGNAMQESGLRPAIGGGGMWQQISNFGSGSGGTLLHQMQTMLPQIIGFRNQINNAGSPGAAAQIFEEQFERAGIPAMANRIKYAQEAYAGRLGGPITGGAAEAPTIKSPKIKGAGDIGAMGQDVVDAIARAANAKMQAAAGSVGGAGGVGPAPMTGPKAVQAMIRKANEIASHNYYYEWGGGHNAGFIPTHGVGHGSGPGVGYDCSGSVSAVLHAAGLLSAPQVAGFFESFGDPGPGKNVTIWAAPWHTFMRINGHYFGTSGSNIHTGANWMPGFPENLVTVRHPHGLAKGGRTGRRGESRATPRNSQLTVDQWQTMIPEEKERHKRNPHAIMRGWEAGGRIPWFAQGGDFIAKRPQLIGVGDAPGGERVTVTPAAGGAGGGAGRPVNIKIDRIEVNRKGDVQKIVDEELKLLADTIQGRL